MYFSGYLMHMIASFVNLMIIKYEDFKVCMIIHKQISFLEEPNINRVEKNTAHLFALVAMNDLMVFLLYEFHWVLRRRDSLMYNE